MIPLIREEVVEKKSWMEMDDFIDMLSIAQSSPGPIAINTAVFVGYRLAGRKGVICSTMGAILPSFLIILILAKTYVNFEKNETVQNVMKAIRPVVAALILSSVYSISQSIKLTYRTLPIPLAVLFFVAYMGLSPILVIFLGALAGIFYFSFGKESRDA